MDDPVGATLDQISSHQALTDDDLLARARAGDPDALVVMVTVVRQAMRRYCPALARRASGDAP